MDSLVIDIYEGDEERIGAPDWDAYEAAGDPWVGAIIKCTQGLHYRPAWFQRTWRELAGRKFRRGCYHYLSIADSGAAQADYFLDHVESAGGWQDSDYDPIVDVETARNEQATKGQVIACVRAFVARVRERTGRDVTLYGGSMLYDLGITDRMGCSHLWIAHYTPTLPAVVYERIGWDRGSLFGWQYCGDGTSFLDGYPNLSPIGAVDITAMVNGPDVSNSPVRIAIAIAGLLILFFFFAR